MLWMEWKENSTKLINEEKNNFKNRFKYLENFKQVGLHGQQGDYEPVSIEEVTILSEGLWSGKSKGSDGIPPETLSLEHTYVCSYDSVLLVSITRVFSKMG